MTPAAAGMTILSATVAAYFLPTFVAVARRSPLRGYVAGLNLLFGWTVVGWFLALAAALRRVEMVRPPLVANVVVIDGQLVIDGRTIGRSEPAATRPAFSFIDAESRDA